MAEIQFQNITESVKPNTIYSPQLQIITNSNHKESYEENLNNEIQDLENQDHQNTTQLSTRELLEQQSKISEFQTNSENGSSNQSEEEDDVQESEESNDEESLQQSNTNHFSVCEICFEEDSIFNLVRLNCGHSYCEDCLKIMAIYLIDMTGEIHKLKCPNSQCPAVLARNVIEDLLDSQQYQKYLGLVQNHELVLNKDKRFCPTPDCSNILEKSSFIISSKVLCNKCNNNICFDCQSIWHQGKSCRQFQKEQNLSWALENEVQKCPKCKVMIEKNDGCDHMTCYNCQHYFCWCCGFPVDHILHNEDIQKYLFNQICEDEQQIKLSKLILTYILLAIAVQIISALIFSIGIVLYWIIAPFILYHNITAVYKGVLVKKVVFYLLFIGYPAFICLGLVTGAILGSTYLVFGIIPMGVVHSYHLIKIVSWKRQGKSFRAK
ncbi:ibr domain containing protein [Stylonychia lemnae]|uniref:RBR-type E3 ubiquitin transferase n=1 Tax=Stylonychia lemnae TaxID=5949 RepID=A0A077ZP01_STYLE|nr:ibr domain containing protein [Stylonychia lemnae]|eukprot:CDW71692.1 ibr domain containing protein [Stylonychia lemnae]